MAPRIWLAGLVAAVLTFGPAMRAATTEVFELSAVEVAPKLPGLPKLSYPDELREEGVEGIAVMEFIVTAEGKVSEPRCVATNHPLFGRASLASLRTARFSPGMIGGRPVATRVQRTDKFNMITVTSRRLRLGVPGRGAREAELPTELWFQVYQGEVPEFTGNAPLIYPYEALLASQPGHAEVQFEIGEDARVHSLKVVKASAPEFAHAAQARLAGSWFKTQKQGKIAHLGPFVAKFNFEPDGGGDVWMSPPAKALLKLLRAHPDQVVPGHDTPPKPLRMVPPVPPPQQSQPGKAVVEVLVDRFGCARLPRVVSCTDPEFGAAAAQAAALWIFVPAQMKGKAVVSRVQIPINFALAGPKS